MLLRGRSDAFSRKSAEVLKAVFPGLSVPEVDGGSALMVENPEAVSAGINEMQRIVTSGH
jgi:hypothetical protein